MLKRIDFFYFSTSRKTLTQYFFYYWQKLTLLMQVKRNCCQIRVMYHTISITSIMHINLIFWYMLLLTFVKKCRIMKICTSSNNFQKPIIKWWKDENQYKTISHHHSNFMTLEPYDEQYQFQFSISKCNKITYLELNSKYFFCRFQFFVFPKAKTSAVTNLQQQVSLTKITL